MIANNSFPLNFAEHGLKHRRLGNLKRYFATLSHFAMLLFCLIYQQGAFVN